MVFIPPQRIGMREFRVWERASARDFQAAASWACREQKLAPTAVSWSPHSLSLRAVSWSHFTVVASPSCPLSLRETSAWMREVEQRRSGCRGLGRGDQFRCGCWFIDPLILSFSRREKGRKLLSLVEMM